MQKEKIIVIAAVLADVIGFGIVIPILPFYAGEFGAAPLTITLMFTAFSFFAFLSAPLLGVLSDRIGRRPVLIMSIISTAVGWFVFASARSIWQLFLGRIIDGMAAGNFTTAQSYMADLAKDEKERTKNLGIIGAVFGVGFLLGPVIGAVLSRVSHGFPFWMAGALAATNALSAFFFLPETNRHRDPSKPMTFNPLRPLVRAAQDKRLRPLYLTWSIFAFAIVTGQSIFGLFLRDVFGFSAFQTGMMFTATGVVLVVNQGVLLNRFWMARFSAHRLEVMMLLVLAASAAFIATESLPFFYLSIVGMGTGQALLRVVITSEVAGVTEVTRKGEAMGILAALMSAYMVVSPVIGGALYEWHHSLPYVVSSLALLAAAVISVRGVRDIRPVAQA